MESDPELDAIRAKLRAELVGAAHKQASVVLTAPVDISEAELEAFTRAHDLVVVDLWAPWCGPCRIVGPIIEQLAREMSGRVAFAKINVDENPGVSRAFRVQGIPTMLLFRKGRLVDRIVGAAPKPQLAAAISRHLGS